MSDYYDDEERPDYAIPPKKKSGRVKTFIGLAAILLLGTCAYNCVGMFGAMSERVTATQNLIIDHSKNGIPAADAPLWAKDLNIKTSDIAEMQIFLDRFGEATAVEPVVCNLQSKMGTSGSGTFSYCSATASFANEVTATYNVHWKKSGDNWQVITYRFNFQLPASILEQLPADLNGLPTDDDGTEDDVETQP